MRRGFLLLLAPALLLAAGCGQSGQGTPSPSPAPSSSAPATPSTAPSETPTLTPTQAPGPTPAVSPTPAPVFPPPGFGTATLSGGTSAGSAVVAVRVGAHDGYDRFVLEFSGALPSYTVKPQPSSTFTLSPRGVPVTLRGAAGVDVRVNPVTNWSAYIGPTDLRPGFITLQEARLVENFEAHQEWGLGVSSPVAFRVMELTGPTRLVVDVASP